MSEGYSGKQFFFVGKAAANRDFSGVAPLDPRTYILQPGIRPIKGVVEPTKEAISAVEKALDTLEKEAQNAR